LRAVFHAVGDSEIEAGIAKDLLPLLDVGAFHANNDRDLSIGFLCGGATPGGENIATQNAAEILMKDSLYGGVAH